MLSAESRIDGSIYGAPGVLLLLVVALEQLLDVDDDDVALTLTLRDCVWIRGRVWVYMAGTKAGREPWI